MLTRRDYDERKARVVAGAGSDDDRRLVRLYEREGHREPVLARAPSAKKAGSSRGQ